MVELEKKLIVASILRRPQDESSDWSNWSPDAEFSTLSPGLPRMDAPTLLTHDRESVTISWYAPCFFSSSLLFSLSLSLSLFLSLNHQH